MGTTQGFFYGFGSPVNLPINCTSPVDFGTANLNNATAPKTITCKANIAVTVTNFNLTGNANFNMTGVLQLRHLPWQLETPSASRLTSILELLDHFHLMLSFLPRTMSPATAQAPPSLYAVPDKVSALCSRLALSP